ncbi:MAG TPA: TetR/AcrR family transcriptional regulator [Streptosporangiaceae bacterium]|nr:TetR/AcrR family transcriptional regulator [Streptosporangiaceae bacterium]
MATSKPPSTRRYQSDQRATQARETRERVLASATAVFLRRGFSAATIREVAADADVSVATVEALAGTKTRLLKAAIDVAIAGDDEPVAVLARPWAAKAMAATSAREFLSMTAEVISATLCRSAGLILAVFEGSAKDPALAALTQDMVAQRAATASWIVERLDQLGALRAGLDYDEAVDTVWMLMDPAIFDRLTRLRNWPPAAYERWIATSLGRLLTKEH